MSTRCRRPLSKVALKVTDIILAYNRAEHQAAAKTDDGQYFHFHRRFSPLARRICWHELRVIKYSRKKSRAFTMVNY